jgi:hypothetical protein
MNIESCENCKNKAPDCNAIPRVEGQTCYLFAPKTTFMPDKPSVTPLAPDSCHALLEALRDTHRHIEALVADGTEHGKAFELAAAVRCAGVLTDAIIAQAGRDNKTRET